jgi:ligand-binding sensor domain-containing protein
VKQILIFSIFICLIVLFWACGSDDSNPVVNTTRVFDPFALWDTASGQLGSRVQCLAAKDTNLYAGTSDSGVYRSTNNGESWTKSSTGLSGAGLIINALLVKDSNLFAGTSGGVYRSTNKGSSWSLSNTGIGAAVLSLVKKDTLLFAGTTSRLYCSTDDGSTWDEPGAVVPGNVTTLVVKGSRLFAGTGSTGVSRSTDNGSTWLTINTGLLNPTIYSLAAKDTNLFAATAAGVFRTSNDSIWTAVGEGLYVAYTLGDPQSIYIVGSNILAGFGGYAGVFLSLNNGASWISANGGLPAFGVYSFVYNGSYLFVGGQGNGTGGAVWRHAF